MPRPMCLAVPPPLESAVHDVHSWGWIRLQPQESRLANIQGVGGVFRVRWVLAALLSGLALTPPAPPAPPPDPAISIWYRGTPAGVPRVDDLAEIRASGFRSITWPVMQADTAADLRRIADAAGLAIVLRIEPAALTPAGSLQPPAFVDIPIANVAADDEAPLAWRAVAHGARVISFDPGTVSGTGLTDTDGMLRPWVAPALALARQFGFNQPLLRTLRPGPHVAMTGAPADGFDAALLEGDRAWVLIATNLAAARVESVVELPPRVPPALWVDLLSGAALSMLSRPDGPRWSAALQPHAAHVWLVDKTP